MLRADELSYAAGGSVVLSHFTCRVAAGEAVGLVHAASTPVTALLDVVATLRRPSGGQLQIGDIDAVAFPFQARRLVGYVPAGFWSLPYELGDLLRLMEGQHRGDKTARREDVLSAADLDLSQDVSSVVPEERPVFGLTVALLSGRPLVLGAVPATVSSRTRDRLRALVALAIRCNQTTVLATSAPEAVAGVVGRTLRLSTLDLGMARA